MTWNEPLLFLPPTGENLLYAVGGGIMLAVALILLLLFFIRKRK